MSDKIYEVPAEWKKRAYIDDAKYKEMYQRSLADPDAFWANRPSASTGPAFHQGQEYVFRQAPTSRSNGSRTARPTSPTTASTAICIRAATRPRSSGKATTRKTPSTSPTRSCTTRFAASPIFCATATSRRATASPSTCPMIPEAAYAMLACARIGAVHSVVFGGFSPDSLAGRIEDCKSNIVITADEGIRAGRKIPLKANTDAAIKKVGGVDFVVVVKRTGAPVDMDPVRDVWYHEAKDVVTAECPCTDMNAEDPLFILYTSGSTGKPKGVLHTTAGYLIYTGDDAPIRLRLSRRRHLLVHRRRRLGHRPTATSSMDRSPTAPPR